MKKADLELYTDYLLSTFGQATATGLSAMVDGDVSHDRITRFLSEREYSSQDLWLHVKSTVRQIEHEDGVLIFDDTIQEKAWTDENDIMCWHYDHVSGRNVRGINLLNALYYSNEVAIPVAFEVVRKSIHFSDLKTQKLKRRSPETKNEMAREMITACFKNKLKFRHVLMDSWFSSVENFAHIVKHKKHFISALKSNRLVALSEAEKKQGHFVPIDTLSHINNQAARGWIKGYAHEVLLMQQVFTNKDGSSGVLYLACSNLTCGSEDIKTIYHKRWKVEVFHKSLKSNACLAKSPTRRITTQNNHIFMSIYAVFKLECLKIKHNMNHFALRSKLLVRATRQAYQELQAFMAA